MTDLGLELVIQVLALTIKQVNQINRSKRFLLALVLLIPLSGQFAPAIGDTQVKPVSLNINNIIPTNTPRPSYDEVLAKVKAGQEERARKAEEARQIKLKQEEQERVMNAQRVVQAALAIPSGSCLDWMKQAGITDTANAYTLVMRESGCAPGAVNKSSGACGLGQQLPCGKWAHVWNDPIGGFIDMQNYVFERYGSWANALAFHYSHNWY